MRRLGSYWGAGIVAAACAVPAAGCREELGPETFRTTRVSGFVREGGRPVGGGWVEFHPVDGTVGILRTAPIGPDGSFRADRVAVGANAIFFAVLPPGPEPGRAFDPSKVRARRVIPDGPGTTMTIDLLEEAFRLSMPRAPAPAIDPAPIAPRRTR